MYFDNEEEREMPSIIQEIVIYDKPNIRNLSPANTFLLRKGDRRFAQVKNPDAKECIVDVDLDIEDSKQTIKSELYAAEPEPDQATVSEKDTLDSLNSFFYYEDENVTETTDNSENDTLILNEISSQENSELFSDSTEESAEKPKEINSFKKPRGRPKKSTLVPRKSPNSGEKSEGTQPETASVKRGRGRPRKVVDTGGKQEKEPTEEVEVKRRRGRKRKIDSHSGQQNDVKNRDVEAEIESMFNAVDEAETARQDQENDEEVFDSDDDSRKEWLPEEYVEYKQQHLMKMKKKTFPCKFCKEVFGTYYTVRKHRALVHDDVGKDRKEGNFDEAVHEEQEAGSSEEEGENGTDTESLAEWMPDDYAQYKMKHSMDKMKRSQWYKCKICCAVFSNYYKLSKHKIEHENKSNPYECNQCSDTFKDIDSLMAHIRIHQGKDPYQCNKCDKGFATKEELEKHVIIHILKKKPTIKRFKCDVCSKEFCKLCDLERHIRVHTGEKPCECRICHKRFQQAHNLSKHLLIHLHVKPFQCEICNKKFGRIDVLNRHILTHSMEKPFKCNICNRSFIRQIQVDNHQRKHHPGVVCKEIEIS